MKECINLVYGIYVNNKEFRVLTNAVSFGFIFFIRRDRLHSRNGSCQIIIVRIYSLSLSLSLSLFLFSLHFRSSYKDLACTVFLSFFIIWTYLKFTRMGIHRKFGKIHWTHKFYSCCKNEKCFVYSIHPKSLTI